MLDPFYGVKYRSTDTDLASDELADLVKNKKFNAKLIRRINVIPFDFSEKEIIAGWMSAVQVQFYGDYRLSLP